MELASAVVLSSSPFTYHNSDARRHKSHFLEAPVLHFIKKLDNLPIILRNFPEPLHKESVKPPRNPVLAYDSSVYNGGLCSH
jgi:hypothetical protein